MIAEAPRRRWPRLVALAAVILAALALTVAFIVFNRSQPIQLDFGVWTWRGEAVHALFAAGFLGLLAMFLLGLPADLRARDDRRRLMKRLETIERELESESSEETAHRASAVEP